MLEIFGVYDYDITKDVERLRHGLVDGFDTISHGKLIDNLLGWFLEIDLPSFVL